MGIARGRGKLPHLTNQLLISGSCLYPDPHRPCTHLPLSKLDYDGEELVSKDGSYGMKSSHARRTEKVVSSAKDAHSEAI